MFNNCVILNVHDILYFQRTNCVNKKKDVSPRGAAYLNGFRECANVRKN